MQPQHAETIAAVDRVLRQRGALLRQAGGKATPDVVSDARRVGRQAGRARRRRSSRPGARSSTRLEPVAAKAYAAVAAGAAAIGLRYVSSWANPDELEERAALHAALGAARADDLRRGVTTVGPHRDELELHIGTLPARTHASQGEQRSLALALRLAVHEAVTETTGAAPVLLLDDVFSELDPHRSAALLANLPTGQARAHHRWRTAGRRRAGRDRAYRRRPYRGHRVTWRPLPERNEDRDPERLGPSLDKVARNVSARRARTALSGLFQRWEELVGAEHRRAREAGVAEARVSCSSRSTRTRGPRSCAS